MSRGLARSDVAMKNLPKRGRVVPTTHKGSTGPKLGVDHHPAEERPPIFPTGLRCAAATEL